MAAGKVDYTRKFKKDSSRNPEPNVTTDGQKNDSIKNEELEQIKDQLNLVLNHLKEQENEQTKTVKQGTKRRSFDLPNEIVFRLKIEAALSGKYMNDILLEALESWFKENGKAPEQLLQAIGDSSDE